MLQNDTSNVKNGYSSDELQNFSFLFESFLAFVILILILIFFFFFFVMARLVLVTGVVFFQAEKSFEHLRTFSKNAFFYLALAAIFSLRDPKQISSQYKRLSRHWSGLFSSGKKFWASQNSL